ncbi:thioredoxin family protein [Pontixanthobacter sp.]|uniref:thioredoxin family protein n=1 Tax=Pontixanthobacter sp. TaxID=2792078 RepID=UPI003C7A9B02
MKKLLSLIAAFAALFALTPVAAAPPWTNYTDMSFARAQSAGKTILVDVHAAWCPTCKAQQPILNELRADSRLKDVVFFKVDFDSDKSFLRANNIPRQSTIVVFQGKKETARSIAETNRKRLRGVVLSAI